MKTLRCRLDTLSEPLLKLQVTNSYLKNLNLKFEKSIDKSSLYSIPFHLNLTLSINPLDYEDILVLQYLNPKLRVSTKRVDGQGLFKFKDALSYIYLKPPVIEEYHPFLRVYTLKGSRLQDQPPEVMKNFLHYYLKVMLTKSQNIDCLLSLILSLRVAPHLFLRITTDYRYLHQIVSNTMKVRAIDSIEFEKIYVYYGYRYAKTL